MSDHLGPRLARKPLHLFWLLDVSGSMGVDGKIEALNDAMRTAVAAVKDATVENPGIEVLVRVVTFAHDAAWHVADPVPVDTFEWADVQAVERGTTELGRAIAVVTDAIREVASLERGLPPALILVSDGRPTDLKSPTFGGALRALAEESWGQKASRVAIGIGEDADMAALHRFIGHDELPPVRAANAAELVHYLRWASTVVVDEGSLPLTTWQDEATAAGSTEPANDDVPPPLSVSNLPPPPPPPATDDGAVW